MVGLLWLWAVYTGYITVVKRTIRSKPEINLKATERLQQEQREKAKDIREKQKRLHEDRMTRMRDLQRR